MKISRCKGCDAEIVWATTVNDKPIPLDFPPQKRFTLDETTEAEGDGWIKVTKAHMHDTYMPHHATCPEVEKFRR